MKEDGKKRRKSRRAQRGIGRSHFSLPEDVLIEVFQRLPIKSLCKFKCLSKVWLSKLSNTNVMRSVFKTIENKPWAVFSNNHMSTQCLSSCMELSGYDGFTFNFLSKSHGLSSGHKLYILASSNGLVLCSAVHDDCSGIVSYFVCNPITKQSVSVPPPPNNSVAGYSYGLVCDTNSLSPAIPCTTAFKIVRLETKLRSKTGFEVEFYFSDLDKWRTYNVAYLNPRLCTEWEASIRNVITHDGVVYWIEEDEINRVVAYDLKINNYECDHHQCNVFSVPILQRHVGRAPATTECIGVSADSVCYAHMRRTGEGKYVFRTWVLMKDDEDDADEDDNDDENSDDDSDEDYMDEDDDDDDSFDTRDTDYYNEKSVWKYKNEIWLPYTYRKESWLMGFSPVNRDVLILDFGDQIRTYDLANEDLCEPSSKNSFIQLDKSEFLHSLCIPLEKYSWGDTKHAYAVIVTPTLTAISKARS